MPTTTIDDLSTQVTTLTTRVSDLLLAVNVQKSYIDTAANASETVAADVSRTNSSANTATTKAAEAATSATAAANSAAAARTSELASAGAVTAATTASSAAATATAAAATATTKASEATTAATTATTKANSASTSANTATAAAISAAAGASDAATSAVNAASSASSAAGTLTTVNTKVTEATTAATTATTKASEAATSAATATTKANQAASSEAVATTKANEATTAAATATTKAAEIVSAAATATTKANEAAASATTATTVANSLDAALSAFRKIHLGTFTTDPTVDGNGAALVDGAEYFNSATDKLRQYFNGAWHNADEAVQNATSSAVLSAANASTSASQAATSASTATTKADLATTKADLASTKADEAAASATIATTKANEAAASATSVGALVTSASNSATSASTSASTAATKATLATTKADEAAASAVSAAASKDAATTSATNAATSETNAATSASAAASSASTANTKATLATTKANEAAASATAAQNAAASVAGIDITIGTVTQGATPSASITGAVPNKVLNLVLVKGDKGDKAWNRRGAWSASVADYKVDDFVTHLGSTYLRLTDATGASATPPATDSTNWAIIAEKGADGVGSIQSIGVNGPLQITAGANPVISLPQASGSQAGYLSEADYATFSSKLSVMPTVSVSGDVTGTGTTNLVLTLNDANANSGTVGSGTKIPVITTNSKGLVINQSEIDIAPDASKQSISAKDNTGGYVGLTQFKINLFNALGAVKSYLTSLATASRTYTFPDKDITVAGLDDIAATSTGVNTGDETTATIKSKLGITTLSGVNTGDQTLTSLGIPNVENKSSATIRSEITSSNVTTALGFTPLANTYTPAWASISGKPSFATVATTGNYSDLVGAPAAYSLPTASTTVLGGVKVDGTSITIASGVISAAPTTWANLSGKPTFATVASTGAYSDLTGLPTLVTLGSTAGSASEAAGAAGSASTAAKSDHVHPHPTALQSGAAIPDARISVAATVSAAGTTQGTATALTADLNVITTAAANSGVLVTVAPGKLVTIINRGANAVKVYPSTGASFDALAANASITVPVNGFLELFGESATRASSTLNAIVNASTLQGTVSGANGGTGVNNSGKTITLGGNLTTSGAFATTLTVTAATNVTLPTTGTLATQAGAETLAAKTMTGESFTRVDKGTVASGTVTFDLSAGTVQRLQVGGALTITASNWAASGKRQYLSMVIVNGGSAVITITPTINWVKPDGTTTTSISTYMTAIGRTGLQASGTDQIVWWTDDAGTTIYGKVI